MELATITKRIRIIAVLLLASIGTGYFFTYKAYNNYVSANSELGQIQHQNQDLNDSLSKVDQFLAEYENGKKNAGTAELALPAKSSDIPNILGGLGDLASASGIVLASFNMTEPEDIDPAASNTIQVINITLGGSGTYASFEDFILRLENHLRLMDIDRINIATQGDSNNFQYQLSLKTYYQK